MIVSKKRIVFSIIALSSTLSVFAQHAELPFIVSSSAVIHTILESQQIVFLEDSHKYRHSQKSENLDYLRKIHSFKNCRNIDKLRLKNYRFDVVYKTGGHLRRRSAGSLHMQRAKLPAARGNFAFNNKADVFGRNTKRIKIRTAWRKERMKYKRNNRA